MLALRVLVTVFVGISFISSFFKNILAFQNPELDPTKKGMRIYVSVLTLLGWLWRALAIVTVWVI